MCLLVWYAGPAVLLPSSPEMQNRESSGCQASDRCCFGCSQNLPDDAVRSQLHFMLAADLPVNPLGITIAFDKAFLFDFS